MNKKDEIKKDFEEFLQRDKFVYVVNTFQPVVRQEFVSHENGKETKNVETYSALKWVSMAKQFSQGDYRGCLLLGKKRVVKCGCSDNINECSVMFSKKIAEALAAICKCPLEVALRNNIIVPYTYNNYINRDGINTLLKTKCKDVENYIEDLEKFLVSTERTLKGEDVFEAYTDGSADYKSRIGGAGYVLLRNGDITVERNHSFFDTTNNRMELLAIISAVNAAPDNSDIVVYSDSQYAIGALSGRQKKTKKNEDLIAKFKPIANKKGRIEFVWVKGHAGNEWNEYVDNLAFSAYAAKMQEYGLKVDYSHR